MSLFRNPYYYEMAFSYRDYDFELKEISKAIDDYSDITVKNILEVACGACPYLSNLKNTNYKYFGLDNSKEMINYAKKKAKALNKSISLFEKDFNKFNLNIEVDFCYVLLGSLYISSTKNLLSHLDSVAKVLKIGGIYFLESCVEFCPVTTTSQKWQILKNGIELNCEFESKMINNAKQLVSETILIDVKEASGNNFEIKQTNSKKIIYPNEFLSIIENHPNFEFVAWFNNWNTSFPISEKDTNITRPITIIKKTT